MMVNMLVRRDAVNSFFDEVFRDFFNSNQATAPAGRDGGRAPTIRARMDVVDRGDQFQVVVDLPGVKKEDIHVNVEGARVSIRAESAKASETKDGDRVLHSERFATSYARSFELPAEVTDENAEAKFDNGVLTLALPKRVKPATRRLAVN